MNNTHHLLRAYRTGAGRRRILAVATAEVVGRMRRSAGRRHPPTYSSYLCMPDV